MKLKILYVTNAYGVGGAEEHLIELTRWLSANDADVAFFVREDGPFRERLRNEGIPYFSTHRRGAKKLLSPLRLARAILEFSPHVISVNREHDVLPTYLTARAISPTMKNKPAIVAVFHTPTGRRIPVLKKLDGVVCTSQYTAKAFTRSNPEIDGAVRVIHYGIAPWEVDPSEKLQRNRKRRFFPSVGFPLIGMVGELWKNQEELVDVAKIVVQKFPNLKVALVGGGWESQFRSVEDRIKKAGLESHFILTGKVPRSKIPDVFHDFDLSVSTHRNEGFGIVHIESLASYTPVVAYNSGGYVEMLNKGGGVLVDGGPEELAKAIIRLLENDEERNRLAVEGRKVVESYYTVERMGREHLEFMKNVLEKPGR